MAANMQHMMMPPGQQQGQQPQQQTRPPPGDLKNRVFQSIVNQRAPPEGWPNAWQATCPATERFLKAFNL